MGLELILLYFFATLHQGAVLVKRSVLPQQLSSGNRGDDCTRVHRTPGTAPRLCRTAAAAPPAGLTTELAAVP
eukprot:1293968-Rhodomonas_salina.1